jgi:hypothetical protein
MRHLNKGSPKANIEIYKNVLMRNTNMAAMNPKESVQVTFSSLSKNLSVFQAKKHLMESMGQSSSGLSSPKTTLISSSPKSNSKTSLNSFTPKALFSNDKKNARNGRYSVTNSLETGDITPKYSEGAPTPKSRFANNNLPRINHN